MRRTGAKKESKIDKIPKEHVEKLQQNPHLASEFDRIYGPGTADEILGKDDDGQMMELTYAGYEPEPEPEEPEGPLFVNGKEVNQSHVDMLMGDPSLAPKFDQFYGVGAAQQVLARLSGGPSQDDDMLNLTKNTMNEGASAHRQEDAKQQAVDDYRAQREASSPKHTKAARKEPSAKHVQMLRDNPAFAAKFDQVYGEGTADSILGEPEDTYRGGSAEPMFPNEAGRPPNSVSPLDLSKIGSTGAAGAAPMQPMQPMKPMQPAQQDDDSADDDDDGGDDSPRTAKWRKENETRGAMGLKPKPHPSKKKK